jgi:hypothetical protein
MSGTESPRFVDDLRFDIAEERYLNFSGIGARRLTFSATLRQAPTRSETSPVDQARLESEAAER